MDLSIILVNYKTAGLALECLATVYRETTGLSFEVIVADNESADGSKAIVTGAYPGVRWIDMGYNAGFARANNEAIRLAVGKVVLLLNADTLVENRAIEGCYRAFIQSSYVACGVQLLNPDGTPQISGSYFVPGGLNVLLPLPYLGGMIKSMGRALRAKVPNVPEARSLVEVDWVNGAFLMVKRDAYEFAGLLDEDFFLYAEEIEWCSRLRRLGKLAIYGQFRVVHLQGASANEAFGSEGKGYQNLFDRKGLQIMLSNFVRIRKQFGVMWFLVLLGLYWLDIPVFGVCLLFWGLGARLRRGYNWAMWRGYCRNVGYITGKSGIIVRNKPYFYKVL